MYWLVDWIFTIINFFISFIFTPIFFFFLKSKCHILKLIIGIILTIKYIHFFYLYLYIQISIHIFIHISIHIFTTFVHCEIETFFLSTFSLINKYLYRSSTHPAPVHLMNWIESIKHELQPPVGNKLLNGKNCEVIYLKQMLKK